ncbi:hypothetical protein GCM10009007_02650 [Formosimonas limnophila]|uniref:Uncharacterized protein n=1 Tax=Formosimonas limnophila TaxID=1384487 RepID=A0A8J3CFP4_9BURK|nr:DUF3667 domain-containing protein [Formosimonas limnophila]GHA65517.1 hypothetical protein GCM10009007_02650 [Formosimonas limnophila]
MKNENLPRIDRQHLQEELQSKWFKKVLLQTFIGLFVAPGHRVRDYINVNRDRLVKPISYLATTLVIYLWFDAKYTEPLAEGANAYKSFTQNLLYFQLLSIFFKAWLMSRFFFKSEPYNFYEYVVLLIYVAAQSNFFGIIFLVGQHYLTTTFKVLEPSVATFGVVLVILVQLAYFLQTIAQFFRKKTASLYGKSIAIHLLGVIFQLALFFAYFIGYSIIQSLFECAECWIE